MNEEEVDIEAIYEEWKNKREQRLVNNNGEKQKRDEELLGIFHEKHGSDLQE